MYYTLLQQRYGVGINKQADIRTRAVQLFNRGAQALNKGVQAVGRVGGRASRDAARTVSGQGSAVKARKFIDDIIKKPEASRTQVEADALARFNTLRDNAAMKLGKDRLIAAGAGVGTGLAGYGTYNMFSGDDNTPTQTPVTTTPQTMSANGWNGWNWDDVGGSLTNYIQSGKVLDHAIPALLTYIAMRAMS